MHWSVKILAKVFSLLWYGIFFAVLVPWLVLEMGRSLDWLVFNYIFKLSWPLSCSPWTSAISVVGWWVFMVGVIVAVVAWWQLACAGQFFPLTTLAKKRLGPQKLVTTGMYAYVRHPMLLGYVIALVGFGMVGTSLFTVVWMVPLFGYTWLKVMEDTEERELYSWFGQEYKEYQEKVPGLIPRFRKPSAS